MPWRLGAALLLLCCACRSPAKTSAIGFASSSPEGSASGVAAPVLFPTASAGNSLPSASASSNALALRVTSSDLLVERSGARVPVFSYARWARAAFERDLEMLAQGEDAGVPLTVREAEVTPLSWVGPLLSFRERLYTTMPGREAHPAGGTRFVALRIDEHTPGSARAVSLADYFEEKVLLRELRKEPRVERALRGGKTPVDLAELLGVLTAAEPTVGTECYSFPDDLLRRFCFDHVAGDRVAVRLALAGTAVCREQLTEIHLLLPMPPALARPLSDASSGQVGFLATRQKAPRRDVHVRMTSTELSKR